jgi:hypothetical protein
VTHDKEIFHFEGKKEEIVYLQPKEWNLFGLKWPEIKDANVGVEPS